MYSINGVPLDNATHEWWYRPGSVPFLGIENNITSVGVPGVDGDVSINGRRSSGVWPAIVHVKWSKLETLNALFSSRPLVLTKTGDATREAAVTFLSSETVRVFRDGWVDQRYLLRLDDAAWRSASEATTSPASINAASVDVTGFLSGMSAPVQDAVVRVKGKVGSMIVSDHAGSWFSLDGVLETTEWLRFEAATGRAFITTADAWIGGTEVSDRIDYGGPRGVFELTPYWSSDPGTRSGKLTVSTLSRSGTPTIEVRGRGAFLV